MVMGDPLHHWKIARVKQSTSDPTVVFYIFLVAVVEARSGNAGVELIAQPSCRGTLG